MRKVSTVAMQCLWHRNEQAKGNSKKRQKPKRKVGQEKEKEKRGTLCQRDISHIIGIGSHG
jgi:hypothetical protein